MSTEVIAAIAFKKYVLTLDMQCREVYLKSCMEKSTQNSPLWHWFGSLLTITQGEEPKDEKKGAILDYNMWYPLFSQHYKNPEFIMLASRLR